MTKIEELQTVFAAYPVRMPLKSNKAIYTVIMDEANKRYVIRRRNIYGLSPSCGRSYVSRTRIKEMGRPVAEFIESIGGVRAEGFMIEFEAVFPIEQLHAQFEGWTTFRDSMNLKCNKVREMITPMSDIYKLIHKESKLTYFASILHDGGAELDNTQLRRLASNSRLAMIARFRKHKGVSKKIADSLSCRISDWEYHPHFTAIPSNETQKLVRELNDYQARFNITTAFFF